MGNDALTPTNPFVIVAEPLCTSAQVPPPETGLASAEGAPLTVPTFTASSILLSRDPLQSLRQQTQLFSSAKELIDPPKDAIPLTCTSVSVSGSGAFGRVYEGSSITRSFTVSNPCDCPVSFYIAGAPYGFSLSSSSGSIPARSSASFSVTFSPSVTYPPAPEQTYNGSISITPGGASISLSGTGARR
jgi:hypothetical protein